MIFSAKDGTLRAAATSDRSPGERPLRNIGHDALQQLGVEPGSPGRLVVRRGSRALLLPLRHDALYFDFKQFDFLIHRAIFELTHAGCDARRGGVK